MSEQHFHLELWSMSGDEDAVQLINTLDFIGDSESLSVEATVWSRGMLSRLKAARAEELARQLADSCLNQVDLTLGLSNLSEGTLSKVEHRATFLVSPTNRLWASLFKSNVGRQEGQDWKVRATHGSRESALVWSEIEEHPTCLQAILSLSSKLSAAEFAARVLQGLQTLDLEDVMGSAEAVRLSEDQPILGVTERLTPWIRAMPLLASRFDGLREVLLGPESLCEKMVDALKGVEGWSPIKNDGRYGGILLDLGEEHRDELASRLKPWLVDLTDDLGPRVADSRRGEYQLAEGQTLLTRRRRGELEERGFGVDMGDGWSRALLIEEDYCQALGIDPDDMLEDAIQDQNLVEIRKRIRASVLKQDPKLTPAERIWGAHRREFESWPFGGGFFGRSTGEVLSIVEKLVLGEES